MIRPLQRTVITMAIVICLGLWTIFSSRASATIPSVSLGPAGTGDAHVVYDKKCAECHGKDGESHTFRGKHTHSRDLTDPQWQDQVTNERIYNSIANGKGKMPAFSRKLSEEDINSLVSFVRNLKR
jgi:mono/diheme cytochrome c family protein